MKTHDLPQKLVFPKPQRYLSSDEITRFWDGVWICDLDQAPLWHLSSDSYPIVNYCSSDRLRHKHHPCNTFKMRLSLLNMFHLSTILSTLTPSTHSDSSWEEKTCVRLPARNCQIIGYIPADLHAS
jgi:hypothetical protein